MDERDINKLKLLVVMVVPVVEWADAGLGRGWGASSMCSCQVGREF